VGLGVFKGKVVRFAGQKGLKIPQLGWNQLEIVKPERQLFHGTASGSYGYVLHSLFPKPADAAIVATCATSNAPFPRPARNTAGNTLQRARLGPC
jgi:imidazole glycerol-phosphate synthase subunit HisH